MKKTGRSGKQSGRPAKLDTRNVRWWRGQVVSCTDLLELIELFPFRKASSCAKPFIRVQICNLFVSSWASFLFAFNRSLWLQYHIFNKNYDGFFCSFRLRFQRKCAIIPSYTALYGFLSTLELEYWFLKRLLRIEFFFFPNWNWENHFWNTWMLSNKLWRWASWYYCMHLRLKMLIKCLTTV